MGLSLDMYTKVTKLVQLMGQMLPFAIFWNWVRFCMKVSLTNGWEEITHIKGTKIHFTFMGNKSLGIYHS
jgi:hypothetical protein